MKIIEALKKIKDLLRKSEDIRGLISNNCAKMSYEADSYDNQRGKIDGWLHAHHDIVLEVETLRERISRTNLETKVTIDIGGKEITKCIHNWISRRRDLSQLDLRAWHGLTDKGLADQRVRSTAGEAAEYKVIRFYDPDEKDKKMDMYKSEKLIIDAKLEVVNATTDLI